MNGNFDVLQLCISFSSYHINLAAVRTPDISCEGYSIISMYTQLSSKRKKLCVQEVQAVELHK